MYERGFAHIIMIVIGLVLIAVVLGMFSVSRSKTTETETIEYVNE